MADDLLSTDDGQHSALISAVITRISAVEDKFHEALTAMEGKVDSTRVGLEERAIKLDEKITELTKMLGDLIGRLNT